SYGSIRLQKCRECDPENGDERINAARCEMHRKELNDFPFKTCVLDEAHRAKDPKAKQTHVLNGKSLSPFRTCVLDEAHRVKDPKAKQTRAIWYVFHQPTVERRWALTGTPIA